MVADSIVKGIVILFQLIFGTVGMYAAYVNAIVLAVAIITFAYLLNDLRKFLMRIIVLINRKLVMRKMLQAAS